MENPTRGCGSWHGYKEHLTNGETPCEPCKEASRERSRQRYRQRNPTARHRTGSARNGACAQCGGDTPDGYAICSDECRRLRDRDRQRRKFGVTDVQSFTCEGCGNPFSREPKRGQVPRWCSETCGNIVRRDRRRAAERDAFVESVNRTAIFERDGWRCQLCSGPVDRSKTFPHPNAPVLDHIIPYAAGGTHEPANVQCAHNRCNTIKGPRAANDQLRLLG